MSSPRSILKTSSGSSPHGASNAREIPRVQFRARVIDENTPWVLSRSARTNFGIDELRQAMAELIVDATGRSLVEGDWLQSVRPIKGVDQQDVGFLLAGGRLPQRKVIERDLPAEESEAYGSGLEPHGDNIVAELSGSVGADEEEEFVSPAEELLRQIIAREPCAVMAWLREKVKRLSAWWTPGEETLEDSK